MTNKRAWLLASYHIEEFGVKGLSELALAEKSRWEVLGRKFDFENVDGLFYLQTCNRIEYLYCLNSDEITGQDMSSLLPTLTSRIYTDLGEITEHLLGVCLSKDSLVFGENQILGQFKRAYNDSLENALLGETLAKLLPWILKEAKAIRSTLPFRHFPSSMSALAAKSIQSNLNKNDGVLFIGAGETNALVAKHLNKKDYANFYFINRTPAKAKNLADNIAGQVSSWDELNNLNHIEAIVCATNATDILIHQEILTNLKPKLVIDLSLPNNVCEIACKDMNIQLLNVESFRNDLDKVKEESKSFMWDLQKHLIDAKTKTLNRWKLDNSAKTLKNFRQHQNVYIERIVGELKDNGASEKIVTNITKELKQISHQQILEFRRSIENEETY